MARELFHAGHYNMIAADIRREIEAHDLLRRDRTARNALCDLAIRLAKRFADDNPRFDPFKFLDACSPDPELYPISALWEDNNDSQDR